MSYNSKYSGQQIENLLDQVANGNLFVYDLDWIPDDSTEYPVDLDFTQEQFDIVKNANAVRVMGVPCLLINKNDFECTFQAEIIFGTTDREVMTLIFTSDYVHIESEAVELATKLELDDKVDKTEIPTKVSQLENDVPYVKEDVVPNGVYAVDTNGKLIDYNSANSSYLGVALVAGEHKFMIAKSDATDGRNTTLHWTKSKSNLSLTNYSNVDGTYSSGYLPKPDGSYQSTPNLSGDFTTWKAGALSDFNGKDNTAVIAAASSDARDMCTVLNTFNAADSYNDWYVPACGQLALMYLNMTEINAALVKIGGTALAAEGYWSSSEYSPSTACSVNFYDGRVISSSKSNYCRVRFVRDISVSKPLKERVSELESTKQDKLVSGTNIKTINGTSILGSGNIVIGGGSGSSSGGGAYAEVSHGTGDTTFALTPNTFHVWDEVASLDLSFADETAGVANEYLFQFTSGTTATTLTLPDVKWANDTAPTIAENMIYQISILKGLASVLEFSNKGLFPITLYYADVPNDTYAKVYQELINRGTSGVLEPGLLFVNYDDIVVEVTEYSYFNDYRGLFLYSFGDPVYYDIYLASDGSMSQMFND